MYLGTLARHQADHYDIIVDKRRAVGGRCQASQMYQKKPVNHLITWLLASIRVGGCFWSLGTGYFRDPSNISISALDKVFDVFVKCTGDNEPAHQ